MLKEVKKLKDHLIILQDENTLVATCLSNVAMAQENMGHKPVQAQKEKKNLHSQSKMQQQFAGIQDKAYLISQANKYIVKDALAKEVTTKANFLRTRAEQFKHMFKNIFDNGLPNF